MTVVIKRGEIAVSTEHEYLPMDSCPKNVRLLLLGPGQVATLGIYRGEPYWLGWFPLPKKRRPAPVAKAPAPQSPPASKKPVPNPRPPLVGRELVLHYLKGQPLSARTLATLSGLAPAVVRQHLAELIEEGRARSVAPSGYIKATRYFATPGAKPVAHEDPTPTPKPEETPLPSPENSPAARLERKEQALRLLRQAEYTTRQIAALVGVSEGIASAYLLDLRREGLVEIQHKGVARAPTYRATSAGSRPVAPVERVIGRRPVTVEPDSLHGFMCAMVAVKPGRGCEP